MSRIIALIDGSVYSESVCDHAAWAAQRVGVAVELVHVLGRREVGVVSADLSGSIGLGARTQLLEELAELDGQRAKLAQKRGRAILDAAHERLAATGVTVTERLRNGDLVETVQELEPDARLVIIGKRGEAADFAKLHLGSNLERVVRVCKKPVLVANRAFREPRKYLIAFDGGNSSMRAVDMASRSPFFTGLEAHILTVGPDTVENRRNIEGAVAMLSASGAPVISGIEAGQPEERISAYVEREGIDLLVMGAYGHSRIRSLIIGSTTSEMVRSCKVPVLMFR
ncbi:universal stress protein [Acuticoccus mangrovi]|uniref:Universal stress protein n=1 Tax=Acuticoccus mangrovi TaxID=2796142 RepID=A0A934IL43_9HYPH|nr:universal stress protein [Acuticoccus mangrovi]MBJ3776971.1 universal stress protein [Acuticoccus mangrovi]